MMGFKDFLLQESVIRTGALATYAARGKRAGDKADQAYSKGKQALQRQTASTTDSERLQRIEDALDAALTGLQHTRDQIGNNIAVDVAGHALRHRQGKRSRGK
ncbi:hypothetical protein [Lentibacter algarum]|uniref:hypothetical protein n=1 Tax=Lentibacter algarum TaxID=576131 RepID=UPI00248F6815|nr:hypothetical protein [Lentibacter algarum]